MSCTLSNNEDRLEEILYKFYEVIAKSQYGGLPKDLQYGFKKILLELGREFNDPSETEELIQAIEDYFSDENMADYVPFLPNLGIAGTIYATILKNDEKVDEDTSSIRIEDEESYESNKTSKTQFMDDLFGTKVTIKDRFKRKATQTLLNAFVINREKGKIIENAKEANTIARELKNQLWAKITQYLNQIDPKLNIGNSIFDISEEEQNKILSLFKANVVKFSAYENNPLSLESLYKSNPSKYDAVESYLLLKYFDSCVTAFLGDVVITDPNDSNPYSNEDKYTFKLHGSNVINTWRTNENIVLENEINQLGQLLITTTPLYNFGDSMPTQPPAYLKFADFYQIVAKLKNAVYNPSLNTVKLEDGTPLKLLICSIRLNPLKYLLQLFEFLVSPRGRNILIDNFKFTPTELNKIYSLYKGVFSTLDVSSINYIQQKYNYLAPNYYNLLTLVADCFYSVGYLQYNQDENGDISIRSLQALSSENTKRELEKRILYNHSRRGNSYARDVEDYKLTTIGDSNPTYEISFLIKANNTDYAIRTFNNGTSYAVYINGLPANEDELSKLYQSPEFLEFIDRQLTLNLSTNKPLYDAVLNKYHSIKKFGESTLELAAHILYNKNLSNDTLKTFKTASDLKHELKNIWKAAKNPPIIDSDLKEMRLMANHFTSKLNEIVLAIDEVNGMMEVGLVKDGDGNMQSLYTLSRLLGSLPVQYSLITSDSTNTAAGFSLLQSGVNKGHFTAKELHTPTQNKPLTQFTVKESIISSFLYDYIFGLTPTDDNYNSPIGNNTIAIYPDVNSDKSTIGKLLIDLSQLCALTSKTFRDMSPEELHLVISVELGAYYNKLIKNILDKYDELLNFITTNYPEEVTLGTYKLTLIDANYTSDFKEFNKFAKRRGTNARKLLRRWTKLYNDKHPNNLIQFTDNIYYEGSSDIYMNTTIRELLRRFSTPEQVQKFFKYKEAELVKLWLEEGVLIPLNLNENSGDRHPSIYLSDARYKQNGWIDSSNNLVYAHVTDTQGNKISISKSNAKLLKLFKDPHTLINSGYTIELHPDLKKYNCLDYLFSLEFILSGVGTHAAHPNKAAKKNNIPIIWGHSALDKTTFLNSEADFSNLFADWDDYFNMQRDLFFALKAGISGDDLLLGNHSIWKNNETYTTIRNNCMNNYKDPVISTDPIVREYLEFVEKNWKSFIDLCIMQNKAALASPGILLDITKDYTGKDSKYKFTTLINIDYDNAVERLAKVLAGENNPVTNEHIANATSWKNGIDNSINNYLDNPINRGIKTIDGTNKYMSELIPQIASELFTLLANAWANEGDRYIALIKRNVSYTAQMHEFQLNLIDGIPTNYKIAVIEDIKDYVHTVSGKVDEATPFDGATFVNPLTVYWENNSLRGDKAGLTKKQFVHFYNEHDGTGGIIKTAGFAITNDKMKKDLFYRNLAEKMLNVPLVNKDGSKFEHLTNGILLDFEGNDRPVGPVYFKRGTKIIKRTIRSTGGNNYTLTDIEVSETGTHRKVLLYDKPETADNAFLIYQMLGGWESMDFSNGLLKPSEKSLELLAEIGSYYGTKVNPNLKTVLYLDEVWQPIKLSVTLYLVTMGAIKHGAANINPAARYTDKEPLLTMSIKMHQAGILLDKEHHAEDESLSLMTLVISAAVANGFTFDQASAMYEALYSLTKLATALFRDTLGNIITDNAQFDNAITSVLFDAIVHLDSNDLDMLLAMTSDIISILKQHPDWLKSPNSEDIKTKDGKSLKEFFKTASEQLPYSNNAIYKKVVSTLASCMTKAGIKIKMPGVLTVLNPTHSITKFYTVPVYYQAIDKTSGKSSWHVSIKDGKVQYQQMTYGLLEDLIAKRGIDTTVEEFLAKSLEHQIPLTNVADVQIGRHYLVTYTNGSGIIPNFAFQDFDPNITSITYLENGLETKVNIDSEQFYRAIQAKVISNEISIVSYTKSLHVQTPKVYKELSHSYKKSDVKIVEDITKGADLDTYNVRFSDIEGNRYLLFDLDIVLDYFSLVDNPKNADEILKQYNIENSRGVDAKKALHAIMQATLRALSVNDKKVDRSKYTVKIKGKEVLVNPDTIDVQLYGIILPKLFASKMHLGENTSINDVVNDPRFFEKELEARWATKVETYVDNYGNDVVNYHLELKRATGEHIYILNKAESNSAQLRQKIDFKYRTTEDGRKLVIDTEGNVIQELASVNDEIWIDDEGNKIIVTESEKNYLFYMDNSDYISVSCNPLCDETLTAYILDALTKSSNPVAEDLGKLFFTATAANGWTADDQKEKLVTLGDLFKARRDKDLKEFLNKHVANVSNKLRTSFLKSLDVVVARIPALSMQSFMAMKVLSFDNPNLNNAYVSLTLFYLQGSKKINTTPLA